MDSDTDLDEFDIVESDIRMPDMEWTVVRECDLQEHGGSSVCLLDDLNNFMLGSDVEDVTCTEETDEGSLCLEDIDIVSSAHMQHTSNYDVISLSSNWSDISHRVLELESGEEVSSVDSADDIGDRDQVSDHGDQVSDHGDQDGDQVIDDEDIPCQSTGDGQGLDMSDTHYGGDLTQEGEGVHGTLHHNRHDDRRKVKSSTRSLSQSFDSVSQMNLPCSIRKNRRQKKTAKSVRNAEKKELLELSAVCEDKRSTFSETNMKVMKENLVLRKVPSLTYFCLRTLHQRKAPGIPLSVLQFSSAFKNIFKHSNEEYSMRKQSVRWVANVLEYFEKQTDLPKLLEQLKERDIYGLHYSDVLFSRNVWNLTPAHWDEEYSYIYRCSQGYRKGRRYRTYIMAGMNFKRNDKPACRTAGSVRSSCLQFTYWMEYNHLDMTRSYSPFTASMTEGYIRSFLASYLDLTMPNVRQRRVRGPMNSRNIMQHGGMEKLVLQMKQTLMKKYPILTEKFFDQVIPYVHWAKGDIQNAVTAFTHLINSNREVKSDVQKLRLLTEMGRMFAHYGWTKSANHCYVEACNLACVIHHHCTDEIKGQMLMMIANLYDQGLMTGEKFRSAKQAWHSVLADHYCYKTDAALASADSILCYHAGKYEDVDWLDEVQDQLMLLLRYDILMAYPLTLVCALQGRRTESDKYYRMFIDSFEEKSDALGMTLVDIFMKRKIEKHCVEALELTTENPFSPILDHAAKVKVQPLDVIWRTQLHPCRVCNHQRSYFADVCSEDPYLKMTEDGYLTGNLHLQLPPIRQLKLNLYTGGLVLGVSDESTVWQSTIDLDMAQKFFCALTPVEVFHDPNLGVRVQMIMPKHLGEVNTASRFSYGYYDNLISVKQRKKCNMISSLIILQWIGPDGQKAKLNLATKLKDLIYKNILLATNRLTKQAMNDEQKKGKKKMRKRHQLKYEPKPFTVRLGRPPVCFGSCLVLVLTVENSQISPYIVFVNCRNRDFFVNPKIEDFDMTVDFGELKNVKGNRILGTDVYFVKKGDMLQLKDECGETLSERSIRKASMKSHILVGKTLVTLLQKGDIVYYHDGKVYNSEEFLEVQSIDLMGRLMAVQNEYGVKFADTSSLPELSPLVIKMPYDMERLPGLAVSENQEQINGTVEDYYKAFHAIPVRSGGRSLERSALALSNYLILLQVEASTMPVKEVEVSLVLSLPGFTTDLCFIHEEVGFVVAWTQESRDKGTTFPYRECLCWYRYSGVLMGILPFLGPGPRSFCAVQLPGDQAIQDKRNKGQGWYLYLLDGHDGVLAVKLDRHTP